MIISGGYGAPDRTGQPAHAPARISVEPVGGRGRVKVRSTAPERSGRSDPRRPRALLGELRAAGLGTEALA